MLTSKGLMQKWAGAASDEPVTLYAPIAPLIALPWRCFLKLMVRRIQCDVDNAQSRGHANRLRKLNTH
jgi:hypothetical protein